MESNALTTLTSSIASAEQNHVAAPILKMCTAITPQFYKNKSIAELQAEALSIELLTQDIAPPVLSDMCKLAICNYPIARSRNERVFFDINYILTFFVRAFNKHFCEDVNLDGCEYRGYSIDRDMWILNEYWERDGTRITVRQVLDESDKEQIAERSWERTYSKAYWRKFKKDNQKRLLTEEL